MSLVTRQYSAQLDTSPQTGRHIIALVRLRWDPDHDPVGARVERRAIQLGLVG